MSTIQILQGSQVKLCQLQSLMGMLQATAELIPSDAALCKLTVGCAQLARRDLIHGDKLYQLTQRVIDAILPWTEPVWV